MCINAGRPGDEHQRRSEARRIGWIGVQAGLHAQPCGVWIVPDHFWIHEVSETSDGCSIVFHRAGPALAVLPRSLDAVHRANAAQIKLEA